MWADEVQILVPLINQPPLVLVALVLAANRSEPELGSLMPMAKHTSPLQMRGRMLAFTRSLPYLRITGPLWRSATKCRRAGALATRNSSVTTKRSRKLRSRPPYFLGQVMPIQPLAPTLRLNSSLKAPSMPPPMLALRVPASISFARKARTSLRSATHSGGRRTGSNVNSVPICLSSPFRQHRPQFLGTLGGDQMPKLHRPEALVAEVVAPGPQPAREAVQRVLLCEADGAQHLMGDGGALGGGLADADLGGSRLEEHGLVERRRIGDGVGGGAGGGDGDGHLAGKPREVVLNGLELGDRTLEGDALVGVGDGQVEDRFERAGHLHSARGSTHEEHSLIVETG